MTTKSWGEAAAEVPKNAGGGGFMKLKQGANKFRILSAPLSGYCYWTKDNKPVRSAEYPKTISPNIRKDSTPRYFWAFIVWNFESKAVEILELQQNTIIAPIQELINSEDWGDPTGYTLTVNRKGEGLDTEYTVVPSPAKPTPQEVLQAYEEKYINLEALLTGKNPFEEVDPSVIPEDWQPKDETETAF